MADNTNSNDPKKLTDSELVEVSGGVIPDEIRAYTSLLPERMQMTIEKRYKDNDQDYLLALFNELRNSGHLIEAGQVDYYRRTGELLDR